MDTLALKAIARAQKEGASCAIFGAISYGANGGEPKPISGRLAVSGICEAEAARGGVFGNGLMLASPRRSERGKNLVVWAKEQPLAEEISRKLAEAGVQASGFERAGEGDIYQATTTAEYFPLLCGVAKANAAIPMDDARIISFGHGMSLFKGLDSLSALDGIYSLSGMQTHAMIAHTRYPTGSSPKIVRAHPFGFGNVGIVHNGDVTSYNANMVACESKLGELYHRYTRNGVGDFLSTLHKGWVGTDSEIISAMLYTLLKTGKVSDPSLSIAGAMGVLVPPFDNHLTGLHRGSPERARLEKRAFDYQGFSLDGPVSCIALVAMEDEVHMIAFQDRNVFRPLQIVIDHENRIAYAASELRQITAATGLDIFSPKVESYSPEQGKFLWVSSRSGVIMPGRSQRPYISVPAVSGNGIPRIDGAPHQFAGRKIDNHERYSGTLGNHGASYSEGMGRLEIVGSMENNCFEASQLDTAIGHANASIMLGNAFQGRAFFLRGSAASRAFQQLRPKGGRAPVAIIGESAGPYFLKMNAGGIGMVLALENLGKEDVDSPVVGDFLMTGAVGGEAYIRGHVPAESIGRPPSRRDVIAVCAALKDEGVITQTALREMRHNPLNLDRVLKAAKDNQEPGLGAEKADAKLAAATARISALFESRLAVESRQLSDEEKARLGPYVEEFCSAFGLNHSTPERLLESNYTIVKVRQAQA